MLLGFSICIHLFQVISSKLSRSFAIWKQWKNQILAILCDLFGMVKWPFKRLSDLQLGDTKVTLNHLDDGLLQHFWFQYEKNSKLLRWSRIYGWHSTITTNHPAPESIATSSVRLRWGLPMPLLEDRKLLLEFWMDLVPLMLRPRTRLFFRDISWKHAKIHGTGYMSYSVFWEGFRLAVFFSVGWASHFRVCYDEKKKSLLWR